MSEKKGVLLINLGTPDEPSSSAVRRYLREFLMDPRVLNMNSFGRWLLVHGIILPTRPRKSAAAYRKVWTEEGSPLLVSGQKLQKKLSSEMGRDYSVKLAMRYGNPSVEKAMKEFREEGIKSLLICPLYPQYAAATTASTFDHVNKVMNSYWNVLPTYGVLDFYEHPKFIHAASAVAQPLISDFKPDHVLFSYHGLPESHLGQEFGETCGQGDCCNKVSSANRLCYRAQCFATSRALVKQLSLSAGQHSSSFQSRLGRSEWIKPYTTDTMMALREKGVKRLAVLCPAFVADCLETIEEIGMELKEEFLELGGEDFLLVPCVNDHEEWVKALADICKESYPASL